MKVTPGNYLPMFMKHDVLAPIFAAAAKDIEAEAQALENARVAAGRAASLPGDLPLENIAQAGNLSDHMTLRLMDRLSKDDEQEGAVVAQALREEAVSAFHHYESKLSTGSNLTGEQALKNAHIRRNQALYKAVCLRLAEAMPS